MKDHQIASTAKHLFDMMGDQALNYALRQQAAFDRSHTNRDHTNDRDDWQKIHQAIEMISRKAPNTTAFRQRPIPHRLPDGRLSAAAAQQVNKQKTQAKQPFSAMDALRAVSLKGFWTRH